MNLIRRNIVLAVAAAALAVPTIVQLQRDADTFVDLARVPLLFDGFTADTVAVIHLRQPKKEQPAPEPANPNAPKVVYDDLVLARTDKGWMLGTGELAGAPVSKERVEADVFTHLRSIRADREVMVQPAATPEQLTQFGLDEAQAFVIRVTDATQRNVFAELLVGRDAGQGQSGTEAVRGVFVRKSDSNDVLLYELEKGWRRDVQQDGWLDKVLARLEPDKIHRLRLKNVASGGEIVLARLDGKASWTAIDPPPGVGAVRQMEVENLVQRLRWIAVQDYRVPIARAGNLATLGLAPAKLEIDLTVKDGDRDREIKLSVGNQIEGKNEYYLQSNESTFLMSWPASTVTPFELDARTALFDPVSPDAKPADPKPPGDGDKKDEKKGG